MIWKSLIVFAALAAVGLACDPDQCQQQWNANVGASLPGGPFGFDEVYGHCGKWECANEQCVLEYTFDGCCDLFEVCQNAGFPQLSTCPLVNRSPFPVCCESDPSLCDDQNECTYDECRPSSGTSNVLVCVNTPIPGDDCCVADSECPSYPCQVGSCDDGTCTYTPITGCTGNACDPADVAGTCPTPPACRLATCTEAVGSDGNPIAGTGVCGVVPDLDNPDCCFQDGQCYQAEEDGLIGPLGDCEAWVCQANECVAVTIPDCEGNCEVNSDCPPPVSGDPCESSICVNGVCLTSYDPHGEGCCQDDADCIDPNFPCARPLCLEDPDTGIRSCHLDTSGIDDCCTSDFHCNQLLGISPNDECKKVECVRPEPVGGVWGPGMCIVHENPDCCSDDSDCPPSTATLQWYCKDGDCVPQTRCTTDSQCDDGDDCTNDACINGQCENFNNGQCCGPNNPCGEHPDPCIELECIGGECVPREVPMCCHHDDDCDSGDDCVKDKCFHNKCVPHRVCCTTDEDCDDRSCSIPHCDPETRQCRNEFVQALCCTGDGNCDDGNPCTEDVCNDYGRCEFIPKDNCCQTQEDCPEGGPCRAVDCIENECRTVLVEDCCSSAEDCFDNDHCTRDLCACPPSNPNCANKVCLNIPIDQDGCCTEDTDCEDNNPWTWHECRHGQCVYHPRGCRADHHCVGLEEGDDCAVAYCDQNNECRVRRDPDCCNSPEDCDDGEICGPANGMDVPNRNVLGHGIADTANPLRRVCGPRPAECTDNTDCDDGNHCTGDVCDTTSGTCRHVWDASIDGCCLEAEDCIDSAHPAADFWMQCARGVCYYERKQCSRDDVDNGAEACNDNNPCTRDSCNADGTCDHMPIDNCCVDDDHCTPSRDSCNDMVCRKRPGRIRGKCVEVPWPQNPPALQERGECCGKDDDCDDLDDSDCRHGICQFGKCFAAIEVNGGTCNETCDDGDRCTIDRIVNGVCRHIPDPNCCATNFDCYDDEDWEDRDRCHPRVCMQGYCHSLDLTDKGCCDDDADCPDFPPERGVCRQGQCANITTTCVDDAQCTDAPSACHYGVCTSSGCVYPRIKDCCEDRSDCVPHGGIDNDCDLYACRPAVSTDVGGGPGRCELRRNRNCCSSNKDCQNGVVETDDTSTVCPSSAPVRCGDGTCRRGGDDCVLTVNVCHFLTGGCVEPPPDCETAADCVSGPCQRAACVAGECVGLMEVEGCCEEDEDCNGADDECKRYYCNQRTHTCQATLFEECCHCDEDCDGFAGPDHVCECNKKGGCDCRPVGTGCTDDAECDDGSDCTLDYCSSAGVCYYEQVDDCCGPVFDVGGAVGGFLDCDDENVCTRDHCDLDTNSCIYTDIPGCCQGDSDCVPATPNPCSEYRCDPNTGTCHEIHNALSGPECGCTDDSECESDDKCVESWCRNGDCVARRIPDCCYTAAECREMRLASGTNDFWPEECIRDLCIDGECRVRLSQDCECLTDDECDDGRACTEDFCRNGECVHKQTCCDPEADDPCPDDPNRPCRKRTCEPVPGNPDRHECVTTDLRPPECCTRDEQCDQDGDECTLELCDPDTHMCLPPVSLAGTENSTCCTNNDECAWLAAEIAAAGESLCLEAVCVDGHCRVERKDDCCRSDAECADSRPCTIDTCNPDTGECEHDDTDCGCDDGVPCPTGFICINGICVEVLDECDPTAVNPCDDGDECTKDECRNGQCYNIEIEDCCRSDEDCPEVPDEHARCWDIVCNDDHNCVRVPINAQDCCHKDEDCDDNDPSTMDKCNSEHECEHCQIECQTDEECVTDEPCKRGFCEDNECRFVFDLSLCCREHEDCDDGQVCTTDKCDPQTGQCHHWWNPHCCTSDEVCQDDNECTRDECINHSCVHIPIATSDGFCCRSNKDCDDGDKCTRDFCEDDVCHNVRIPGCCHHDSECPSKNGTVGFCNDNGVCDEKPIPGWCSDDRMCNDNNPCTIDKCRNNVCVYQSDPDCDGCRHDKECEDGDKCTVDRCVNGHCVQWLVKPGDHGTECDCYEDKHCDDNNKCTTDECINGMCVHNRGECCEHSDCDDHDACTEDLCVETSSGERRCMYIRHYPGDPDWPECMCLEADDCVFDPPPPPCAQVHCRAGHCFVDYSGCNGCTSDDECDDLDECTKDICDTATGECLYEEIDNCCSDVTATGSLSTDDCDDGNPCTVDYCANGVCVHDDTAGCCDPTLPASEQATFCDDDDHCTWDFCRDDGSCGHEEIPGCCRRNADCNDFDLCTRDWCNPDTHTCEHEHAVGSDGEPAECCDSHEDCIPDSDIDECIRYWCEQPVLYVSSTGTPVFGPGICREEDICGDCTTQGCDDGDICTEDKCVTNADGSTSHCVHRDIPECCVVDCDCDMPARPVPGTGVSVNARLRGGSSYGSLFVADQSHDRVQVWSRGGDDSGSTGVVAALTQGKLRAKRSPTAGAKCVNNRCWSPPKSDFCDTVRCKPHPDPCYEYVCNSKTQECELHYICCTRDEDCDDDDSCTLDRCHNKDDGNAELMLGGCRHQKIRGCCNRQHPDCSRLDDPRKCLVGVCNFDDEKCTQERIPGCCTDHRDCPDDHVCEKHESNHGQCVPRRECSADQPCPELSHPCRRLECDLRPDSATFETCLPVHREGCCIHDSECNDGLASTIDLCLDNTCVNRPRDGTCFHDDDCDGVDSTCHEVHCSEAGRCVTTPRTGVDGCCGIDNDCDGDTDDCIDITCNTGSGQCEWSRRPNCCDTHADCRSIATGGTADLGACDRAFCDPHTKTCSVQSGKDDDCCETDADCPVGTNECIIGVCERKLIPGTQVYFPPLDKSSCRYIPNPDADCCKEDRDCASLNVPCAGEFYECVDGSCELTADSGDLPADACCADDDCDDGLDCTEDKCADGTCVHHYASAAGADDCFSNLSPTVNTADDEDGDDDGAEGSSPVGAIVGVVGVVVLAVIAYFVFFASASGAGAAATTTVGSSAASAATASSGGKV